MTVCVSFYNFLFQGFFLFHRRKIMRTFVLDRTLDRLKSEQDAIINTQ